MKIRYPAKINYIKEDKSFLVEFPDLKGCLTEGTTPEDALTSCSWSSFKRKAAQGATRERGMSNRRR